MKDRDITEELEEAELKGEHMPRGVYERKPKTDAATTEQGAPVKRKGRPPKAGATYDALLAQLRAERERLVDKVAALGTAIEALESLGS